MAAECRLTAGECRSSKMGENAEAKHLRHGEMRAHLACLCPRTTRRVLVLGARRVLRRTSSSLGMFYI
jgi:hypothetical protein